MSTPSLFRTDSSSSNQMCYEKASSLQDSGDCNIGLTHSSSSPKPSLPRTAGGHNTLAKIARRLRSLVSVVQNMGGCGGHSQESSGSQPHPNSHIQEKLTSTPRLDAQSNPFTQGFSKRTRGSSMDSHEQVSWMGLSQNNPHTSTNLAYKSSVLFSDETLRFANAFVPPMEPLNIWGIPALVEGDTEPPSTSWVRRHTCIRPGNVVQLPSVSDKGAIYRVSCQKESEWQYDIDLSDEKNRFQKLFIAQAESGAGQPLGYSRAFIMCKPGSEF